jgi:hypothetical protein
MVREASAMRRTAGPDAAGRQSDTGERPGGDAGVLDELRFHGGSAYNIGAAGGAYTARRRDGTGVPLTDALPEGLRLKIAADYERMPVPRDLP